MKLSSV